MTVRRGLGRLLVTGGADDAGWQDRVRSFVDSLPGAEGDFSGTFDAAVIGEFLPDPDELFPVDLDTGGEPNPAAEHPPLFFTVKIGGRAWTMPVEAVQEHEGTNRVTLWCRRPAIVA